MHNAEFPQALQFLFEDHRYKVAHGGRGGTKSWGFARALIIKGAEKGKPRKILCAREIQKSIQDSVHALLKGQIEKLGIPGYTVQETRIFHENGTEIIFAGLKHNINNIKSLEDVDIVWVEEAQSVSKASWEVLIPTIRKPGSEIWVTFNPDLETDNTYQRFVNDPPSSAKVVKIGWRDNPWFPDVLKAEKDHLKAKDPDEYENVWEGACKQVVEGAVYKDQLVAADKEQRITSVPYNSEHPVHTFWDLGFGDNVSIWFAQSIGFEFRLIDFEQNNLKDVSFYLKALQERGYIYGTHYLPHDGKAETLVAGGRTIQQQVQSGGRTVEIVPRQSVDDGIAAARTVFPRCWFDSKKCSDGLQALRHYHWEKDEKLQTFKRQPVHDWSSHAADAFRYFAVAIREPARQQEVRQAQNHNRFGEHGWMA
jgi:phage terminase large subunit